MGQSIAEQVAALPPEEREEVLAGLDMEKLQWDWSFFARPEQQPPLDDSWDVGLALAGRGFGKTRMAAEWVREKAKDSSKGITRFLLVARTAADVRDVVVDGEPGILNVTPPSERPTYIKSQSRLEWPNGNIALLQSADEPDSLRGVQAHYSWGDEIAAWRQSPDGAGMTAWDNLRVATRLGQNPQILATTTPKRVPILFNLIEEHDKNKDRLKELGSRVWITRGSTYDNKANMPTAYLNAITGVYAGTPMAQQELHGEMLEAIKGALWNDDMIIREHGYPPHVPLRIVGVDPSVAENPNDECGIVVVGATNEPDLFQRRAWVLEDASVQGAPSLWAQKVVDMAKKWGAPVVAEKNQGGALVRNAIHQIDPSIVVYEVHSMVGKKLRAEPVSLAYYQKRVKHVGLMPDLETQMITWDPENSKKSPDRVDALVHALSSLLVMPPRGIGNQKMRAKSLSGHKLNLGNGFSTPQRGFGR